MARSLTEIARQLDELNEALTALGQSTTGSDEGKYEVYDKSGVLIDVSSLADDLREHAENAE